ncbi:hypothetical protein DFH08DRAFT_862615 [Mycena albidolilacea]|uniref:Uncharacterized protein n=1 Tax=Mycena albidolilacea TaxID=1033008 RepID=A0AAD7A780_9AGAR|nr:hypothetical protein DFH08DRAFT_862615 [Mycena albidolilacea]
MREDNCAGANLLLVRGYLLLVAWPIIVPPKKKEKITAVLEPCTSLFFPLLFTSSSCEDICALRHRYLSYGLWVASISGKPSFLSARKRLRWNSTDLGSVGGGPNVSLSVAPVAGATEITSLRTSRSVEDSRAEWLGGLDDACNRGGGDPMLQRVRRHGRRLRRA